ncbi:MAG: hypothetical protein KatS3mg105_2983 [Gemmatales bacterium]|nr:MAG: hypothetical protein KatS3mg105_2983 [Gemmatales bacterium]
MTCKPPCLSYRSFYLLVSLLAVGYVGNASSQTYFDHMSERRSKTVEQLRRALTTNDLRLREERVKKAIAGLRHVGDLRQALELKEWNDEDLDIARRDLDRRLRGEVLSRFQTEVRRAIQTGNPSAILAVTTMLGEMGTKVRGMGATGIAATAFAPDLAKLTKSDNGRIREEAANALGTIHPDPRVAVPALSAMLRNETSVGGRLAAARALASMVRVAAELAHQRGIGGIDPLQAEYINVAATIIPEAGRALEDSVTEVRLHGLEAFRQAGILLTEVIPDPFPERDLPAPDELKKLLDADQQKIKPVVDALVKESAGLQRAIADPTDAIALRARRALEEIAEARLKLLRRRAQLPIPPQEGAEGQTADAIFAIIAANVKALGKGLEHPDVRIRLASLDILEAVADTPGQPLGDFAVAAVPALSIGLEDSNRFVRWQAIRILGKLGPVDGRAEGLEGLIRMLHDDDLDLQVAAANTLAAYGPLARPAISALGNAVERGDPEMRIAAMETMQAIGSDAELAKQTVPILIHALQHDDARVRATAAQTLGEYGEHARTAEPALMKARQDSDPEVREAAADALLNILVPPKKRQLK